LPGWKTGSLTRKEIDRMGVAAVPRAGAKDRSLDSFQSFQDRHGGSDPQPLCCILSNNHIVDALSQNAKNPQELRPATERSKQAPCAGGIKINAPANDRRNISSSLHDDEF